MMMGMMILRVRMRVIKDGDKDESDGHDRLPVRHGSDVRDSGARGRKSAPPPERLKVCSLEGLG
jgi:hypothetical protein